MKYYIALLLLFLSISLARGAEITVVTEHYPPYQVVEGSNLSGLSVDIVNALLDEVGVQTSIEALPWARAYRAGLEGKNVLIFSLLRSEEREELFKWVGEITGIGDLAFWGLKSPENIEVNSFEDAKQYIVAVPAENFPHKLLQGKGFTSVVLTHDFNSALKMLYAGRIQLVLNTTDNLLYRIKTLELDLSKIEKKYVITPSWRGLYIAFSTDTPDEVVEKFRLGFERIKQNGVYDQILKKWNES